MKRSSPPDENGNLSSKRQRLTVMQHHSLKVKQPGLDFLHASPQDGKIIEDELTKAVCAILYDIGFTNIRTGALESFRALVQECKCRVLLSSALMIDKHTVMTHFCSRVVQSMNSCRRHQPLPQDFTNALAQFSLTPSSLEPELSIPAPPAVFQTRIYPPSPEPTPTPDLEPILRHDLSGAEDKRRRDYIPSHFPSFPGQHAYKDTAIFVERETDARKIRELTTQEGMLAEQALRKLMQASKAGKRKIRGPDDAAKKRAEEVWQEAWTAAAAQDRARLGKGEDDVMDLGLDGAVEMEPVQSNLAGPVVNYDRAHWRVNMRGPA